MSYDIYLRDPVTNDVLELNEAHQMRGETYQIGGTQSAWVNITSNYGGHYKRVLGEKGIRSIYGLTGAVSIPLLRAGADQLGDDVSPDYWAATEGNAKRALLQLIALAELRPDGVWDGD